MKLKFIITFLTVLYTPYLLAGGWFYNSTISELQYSAGADGVHILFAGGTGNSNPDTCDVNDKFILAYTLNTPERQKAMLSGASMAFAANKKVDIFLNGCMAGIGGKTYPTVYYFNVKN